MYYYVQQHFFSFLDLVFLPMQEVDLFIMFHPFIHIHSSIGKAKGHDQNQKCLFHNVFTFLFLFLRCAPLVWYRTSKADTQKRTGNNLWWLLPFYQKTTYLGTLLKMMKIVTEKVSKKTEKYVDRTETLHIWLHVVRAKMCL